MHMNRNWYIVGLAAVRACRERRANRGSILVFAAAVAAIVLVEGAAGGAARNAREYFRQMTGGSAFLFGLERSPSGRIVELSRRSELEPALASLPPGSTAHERTSFPGRLRAHGRSAVAAVQGLDFRAEPATMASLPLVGGDAAAAAGGQSLVIGAKAAAALSVGVGDEVVLEARDCRGRATVEVFGVAAIAKEPALAEDGSAWLALGAANRLRGYGDGEFGYLAIEAPRAKQGSIAADLGGIRLIEGRKHAENLRWGDPKPLVKGLSWEGRAYLYAGEADFLFYPERLVDGILLAARLLAAIILALGAVGASSSFRMLILERGRELGAFRAMGATRAETRRLAAIEALVTGLGAGVAGLCAGALGLALLGLASFTGAGEAAVFLHAGKLRPVFDPATPLLALAACAAAAALGALGPARSAGRIEPASALGEGLQ
jgi:ABC-type lipoprotein release transport system permease subunit